ncbi:MAG: hypothetical protein ACRD2G_08200 [Terriglobia bacterium]
MNTGIAGRRAFVFVAILEVLSIVPLAIFLPFSTVALVFAVGILAALNASMLVIIPKGAWFGLLEFANLAICAACLVLALQEKHRSLFFSSLAIGVLCLLLFILGFFSLSDRLLKRCFTAQQVALASTLIFWTVIWHFGPVFESSGVISVDHFRAGLRLLFAGPLALVGVAFFAGVIRQKGYLTALAGICAGQWAVGFFELGAALQAYALMVAAFVLLGFFVLLLALGAMSGRHPRTSDPPDPATSLPPAGADLLRSANGSNESE